MSELTQDEKRIKIARSLGAKIVSKKFKCGNGFETGYRWQWKNGDPCSHPGGGYYGWGWNREASASELPDYFSDLNACHEAEKVLMRDVHDYLEYAKTLAREIGSLDAIFATATQRAEAFGKTLKLW